MIGIFILLVNFVLSNDFSIKPYAVISDTSIINEGSALLYSKNYPSVIWTLNDSGDQARIFAFDINGNVIKPSWVKKYAGVKIYDAYNVDWEAITSDDEGNIYIIDAGNNYNYRKDLTIYKMREPNPYLTSEHGIISKYIFEYPDQKKFPDELNMNFDCEAAFVFKNRLCLITKTRSTTLAGLYCFNELRPNKVNIPKKINQFDFKSMVTDASVSIDKKYLAVLTYNYVYIFELLNVEDLNRIFSKPHHIEISLGQAEGITFMDKNTILISNEEGYLFKIDMKSILR